jgi:hypothetical protein
MRRFIIPLAIFLISGLYYYHLACPTFYYWDSAELTAAVLGNGVPHPPGFPFFLILAKFWVSVVTLVPLFSLNIFSGFFGALGLVLWYLVIFRVIRYMQLIKSDWINSLCSLLAVAIMGISLTYSIQATRFEVYSLNFAGFASLALICLAALKREKPSIYWAISFFAILGLMLGVHNLTIALAIPGLLLFLLWQKKITLGNAILGTIFSFILSGLLYLDILFRAGANPPLNWGDPSSLGNLVDYILIKGFSASITRFSPTHIIAQLGFAYDVIYRQLGPAALALALFGLGYMIVRKKEIGFPLLIIYGLNILSVAFAENYFYENYDLHGYLMISLAISVLSLGIAFTLIYGLIMSRLRGRRAGIARFLGLALFIIFAMLILAPPARDNYKSADLSKVRGADEYAAHFLSDAPDSAIILTSSYNTYFCALAHQAALPLVRQRTVLNLYNWDHDWGRNESDRLLNMSSNDEQTRQGYYREFLNRKMKSIPIYIEYDPASAPIAQYLIPHGLGYLFIVPDSTVTRPKPSSDSLYLSLAARSNDLETIRTWAFWLNNRGEYYKKLGNEIAAQPYLSLIDSLAAKADLK